MKRISLASLVLGPALLLAALLAPGSAAAAGPITSTACSTVGTATTCNLWAKSATPTIGGTPVTIWGFSETSGGSPTLPGPTLIVNQGDAVTVNLTNTLSRPTSILFTGQAMVPDISGAAALGGTKAYAFTATTPGTYLYEAGLIPGSQYQVAMGLHGLLIVRPTGQPFRAYADAATAFSDEATVVVSEIDPALNNSASPWTVDLRAYAPKYFLMNGQPYTSASPSITTASGNKLLLRYANAGILAHSLGVLGLHQSVVGSDGSQLPAPRTMVAETLAPGQTADVLVSVPTTAATSTKYVLYDAAMALNNSNANGIGGMLAIIDAAGIAGGDVVGPTTSGVAVTETAPNSGLYTVTASVSDVATGNAAIQGAEVRADAAPVGPFAMSATDSAFDTATEAVTSSAGQIDTTTWAAGTHTVFVRGRDALGNWGPYASATIAIDRTGPTTSALTLTPNPSSGSSIALSGTASDVATGNGNVVAAEYWLGAPGANGSGIPVTRNNTSPTVSLSATIPPQLSSVVVSVHAQDAAGNWGPYTTINLTVDTSGPTTTGLSANPSANNGTYGQSSGNPSVRVSATVSDVASGGARIAAGEGFIDGPAVVTNGTGFPFYATDGTFSSATEAIYADIPLNTINALSAGNHTIRVHGKDAGGNWGATVTINYLIDRTAPTFSSISLAPSPTLGAATVTMTVSGASDPAVAGLFSGVAGGEWWVGTTAPAAGSGTPFSGLTPSIPTSSLPFGTVTIGARVRDAAGNWSIATHTRHGPGGAGPDLLERVRDGRRQHMGLEQPLHQQQHPRSASRLRPRSSGPGSSRPRATTPTTSSSTSATNANPAWPTFDARFYFNPNGNTAQARTSSSRPRRAPTPASGPSGSTSATG